MTSEHRPIDIPCRSCGRESGFEPLLRVITGYRPGASLQVVVCPDCGMFFLNPQYQFDAYSDYYQKEYYAEGARSIDQIYETAKSNVVFQPYLARLARHVPPGGTYLDVGAGTGQWLDYLRAVAPEIAQEQIHVLEPSDISTDFIRRRYPGISVQRSMLEDNSYPDEFFDGVLCAALIEHFTDPLESLLRFNRIMKTGGHLMLVTPSFDEHSFARGPQNVFKFPHTFYYSTGTLASLLEKAGFAVDTQEVFYDPGYTWYGFLIVIARKVEPRAVAEVARYRKLSAQDAQNSIAAQALLRRVKDKVNSFRRDFRVWSIKKKIKSVFGLAR